MTIYTCRDYLKTGPAEPAMRVDGLLLVAGVVVVAGLSLDGKSRLIVGLVAAVDNARDAPDPDSCTFLGRRLKVDDIGERQAVIVAGEHADASWRALIRAAAKAYGREELAARIVRPAPVIDLTNDQDFGRLRALVETEDPWLVVVDSMRALHLGDENASADTREVMRRLSELAGERRLVTPVHHLGANGTLRGSTDLQAAADGLIETRRSADRLALRIRSHDAPDSRLTVRMVEDGGGLRFEPVEAEAAPDDEQRRRDSILEALDGGARLSNGKLYKAAREAAKRAQRGPLGQDRQILATARGMVGAGLLVEEGEDVDHVWRRSTP